MSQNKKIYFAYGSNMDRKQMKERCPDSKFLGKALLKDYKLSFTIYSPKRKCGCADIVKNPGGQVWGLIYSLTDEDLARLDDFEGHPIHYKRFNAKVLDETNTEIDVVTYEVVNKQIEHQKPSAEYFGIIKSASEIYAFPESYKEYLDNFHVLP